MPGYVIHMATASRLLEEKGETNSSFIDAFLLGNIIPDAMARNAKKESHFWDDETYKNLNRIPNMEDFLSEYGDSLGDPFVLGYYTHLLLDNLFVKEYWGEHFDMLDKDMNPESLYEKVQYMRVKNDGNKASIKGTGAIIYPREDFFSDRLYYGDYDRMYPYILEKYNIQLPKNIRELDEIRIPISQINREETIPILHGMLDKVSRLCDRKNVITRGDKKEPLKIFELEHIYNLIEKVVSNVCYMI
ncbi:MAG: hypothetical protein J6A59_11415 [Lachnospiraceae bacterium]|nr:hypothetical protein [Lachnospiraceae bacterium]